MTQRPKAPGAVASLVLGILSYLIPYFVGLILGIIGIVQAGKALRTIEAEGEEKWSGKGIAIAGRILSIVGIVVNAIVSAVLIGVIGAGGCMSLGY